MRESWPLLRFYGEQVVNRCMLKDCVLCIFSSLLKSSALHAWIPASVWFLHGSKHLKLKPNRLQLYSPPLLNSENSDPRLSERCMWVTHADVTMDDDHGRRQAAQ